MKSNNFHQRKDDQEDDTDQYGRKKFIVKSNQQTSGLFQPPKPKDLPPSLKPVAAEKRKLLQPVDRDFDPEQQLGKSVTITSVNAGDLEAQSVFYCKTCKVQLKDSNAWYDHINGKKHNQMLGMSMVVERVSVDKVKEKLAGLKRQRIIEASAITQANTIEEIQNRIEQKEKEEEEERLRLKKRKIMEQDHVHSKYQEQELEFDEEDITAFGLPMDFGSKKKK